MPATGFRVVESGVGSPALGKLSHTIGGVTAILDKLLTQGSSPWSKVDNGGGDVTYTMPSGSQASLNILDDHNYNSNFFVRCRLLTAGSPQVQVPTTTQEGTSQQGFVVLRARGTTLTGTTRDPDWLGIRTDRFMMLHIGMAEATTLPGFTFVFGDLPTLSASDPGLTCILGQGSSVTSTTSSSDVTSLQNGQVSTVTSGRNTNTVGYTVVAADGISGPVSTTCHETFSPCYMTLPDTGGDIPLGRMWVVTTKTASEPNPDVTGSVPLRGYVPYLYTTPFNNGAASGLYHNDRFTDAAGREYRFRSGASDVRYVAYMISDDEDLP